LKIFFNSRCCCIFVIIDNYQWKKIHHVYHKISPIFLSVQLYGDFTTVYARVSSGRVRKEVVHLVQSLKTTLKQSGYGILSY
jgi:hypothetical protein